LAHGKQREDQVQAIDSIVASRTGDTPSLLMGDFNARPSPMRFVGCAGWSR